MVALDEFSPGQIRLRLEPILRFQRYRNLDEVAPAIREVAAEMASVAEELAEPRVVFRRRRVEKVYADGLRLEGGPTFSGQCLGTHLRAAREAICFLTTIGPVLDERVARMAAEDELLEALFLDTAGWLAIEETLRGFRAYLLSRLRAERLRVSPRLGPGYLDWPLTDQTSLFSVFAGTAVPVALSDECVMTPKKSVSGLFGLVEIA